MSIFYRKYKNTNTASKPYGQWYGRAVTMGKTVTLEDLAEHMAQHNTPYSEGVIKGVLTDMVNCIRELVLEGKSVKIPNLCIFSAGIKTTGANKAEDFSAATNVLSAYLKARSTGRFTREEVTKKASIRELPEYTTGDNGTNSDEPVIEP
ncbi:MAG: DNA-binding protein [Prevotella sp.]|nr:DNA-binding protein [Prevotella sp.]